MKKSLLIVGVFLFITAFCNAQTTNNAYGDNQVQVEPGVFAIYTGDVNQDGYIDVYDFPQFDFDSYNFASGYLATDFNGDGYTDVYDFPVFDLNSYNFVSLVRP